MRWAMKLKLLRYRLHASGKKKKEKKKTVFDVIVSIVRTPDCMQVCEM